MQAGELDAHGFLIDTESWDEDKGRALAARLGIDDVGESHRRVWTAYREHYGRLASIPPTNVLCRELDLDDDCIDRLFKGPLNAWQSAGLPDPGEEARVYLDNQTHDDID